MGKAKIITTVSRPILTDEERAERMEAIKNAAIDLIIATELNKKGLYIPAGEEEPRVVNGSMYAREYARKHSTTRE